MIETPSTLDVNYLARRGPENSPINDVLVFTKCVFLAHRESMAFINPSQLKL